MGISFLDYVRPDYVPSSRVMFEQHLGRMDQVELRHVVGDERWAALAAHLLENGRVVGSR